MRSLMSCDVLYDESLEESGYEVIVYHHVGIIAFSSMNIVKTELRNKIEDYSLSDCIILHMKEKFLMILIQIH